MDERNGMKGKTLKANGFDSCVIGIGTRVDMNVPILVYDYDKCARLLADRDGMPIEDAYEFMEFNVVGAWHGEGTPMFVRAVDSMEEAEEWLSELAETEENKESDGLDEQVVS